MGLQSNVEAEVVATDGLAVERSGASMDLQ